MKFGIVNKYTEEIVMCLCRNNNCRKMMADCGDPKHPGWYCYRCSIGRIAEVKDISIKEATIGFDYGKYLVTDQYEVLEK